MEITQVRGYQISDHHGWLNTISDSDRVVSLYGDQFCIRQKQKAGPDLDNRCIIVTRSLLLALVAAADRLAAERAAMDATTKQETAK